MSATANLEATSSTQISCMKRGSEYRADVQIEHFKRRRKDVVRPGIPTETHPSSFVVPDRPSPPLRDDDPDGHYTYVLGDSLSSRYKILSKMGEGTFGRVLECWDRKHKDYVAIKIVRNIERYRHAAMIELEVLNTLESNDPDGNKLVGSGWVEGMHDCREPVQTQWDLINAGWHACVCDEPAPGAGDSPWVFEKLGPSLFDLLRRNRYEPLPIRLVQDIARQLIESVAFMHELSLIHTDLKPENILFAELMDEHPARRSASVSSRSCSTSYFMPGSSEIKVIDFGSATFEEQYHSTIVSTRHYRAPEVILGMGWSFAADIWSIGCILMELMTGDALFQTHDNLEHLGMMERVLGPIPESTSQKAGKAASKYFKKGRLNWPAGAATKKSLKAVQSLGTSLKSIILEQWGNSTEPFIEPLCDLLTKLLKYDPDNRLRAHEALGHQFLSLQLSPNEEGTSAAALAQVSNAAVGLSAQTSSMPTTTMVTAVETGC
eukprot:gene23287-30523_t